MSNVDVQVAHEVECAWVALAVQIAFHRYYVTEKTDLMRLLKHVVGY